MAQTAVVSNTPFLWEGTDRNGKKIKGKSLASDEATVRADLRRQGVVPTRIRKQRQSLFSGIEPGALGSAAATIEAIRRIKVISARYDLPIVIFGHAGDGNLHPNILFDKRAPEQWAKVEQMVAEEFAVALELGGTLSGEHGIGAFKVKPDVKPHESFERLSRRGASWLGRPGRLQAFQMIAHQLEHQFAMLAEEMFLTDQHDPVRCQAVEDFVWDRPCAKRDPVSLDDRF